MDGFFTKILQVLLIGTFYSMSASGKPIQTVDGGALYLMRNGIETHSGEFDSAQDCVLIAETMNRAEPKSDWYCSTSVPPTEFECYIDDARLESSNKGVVKIEKLRFSLALNRNKAKASSFSSALLVSESFDYKETDHQYVLTNSNPHIQDDYFSKPLYSMSIDRHDGSVIVFDFDLKVVGKGICRNLKTSN